MPLILILFILPDCELEWVKVFEDELIISKHAYWYYPDANDNKSGNSFSQTIEIPLDNKIDFSFFQTTIKQWM